jgi:hypothetical protein
VIGALAFALAIASTGDGSRAFARAAVGPEPVRAYVDLGPILVPSEVGNRERFDKLLQLEGDRLGADGFFVSEGDPTAFYAPGMTSPPFWSQSLGPVMVVPMAIVALLHKESRHPVVLRAYTFRDLQSTTRERLMSLSRQVVLGEITVAEFEMRRTELLAN